MAIQTKRTLTAEEYAELPSDTPDLSEVVPGFRCCVADIFPTD